MGETAADIWHDLEGQAARLGRKRVRALLAAARAAGDGEATLHALALHACSTAHGRQLEAALISAVEAEQLAAQGGRAGLRAEMLSAQARAYYQSGQLAKAAGALSLERGVREALGDAGGLLRTLARLGRLHFTMGDLDKARDFLERVGRLRRGPEDEPVYLDAQCNLASLLAEMGDPEGALGVVEAVRERLHGRAGDSRDAYLLAVEADAQNLLGHTALARKLGHAAADVARLQDNPQLEASGLCCVGESWLKAGDPQRALAPFGRALELSERSGSKVMIRMVLHFLSQACEGVGDLAAALRHFRAYHDLDVQLRSEAAAQQVGLLGAQLEKEQFRREAEEARAHAQRLQHERSQLEGEVRRDSLTGLGNRRLFEERLHDAVEIERLAGGLVGVVYLDLDGFKAVNDALGHAAGDEVLRAVARALRGALRTGDAPVRLGGDEFAVVLPALQSAHAAVVLGAKLVEVLRQDVGGLCITASVGVAVYPDDGADAAAVAEAADRAMYLVKRDGKNGVRKGEATPGA